MINVTAEQIKKAAALTARIVEMEEALKTSGANTFHIEGTSISATVPEQLVREVLANEISRCREQLALMHITLST